MQIKKIINILVIFLLLVISVYLLFKPKKDITNQLNEKDLIINKLNKRISSIENEKNLSNKKIFPETQFAKFFYEKIKIPFKSKGYVNYTTNSGTTNPFYISSYENNAIIISKNSEIFYLNFDKNNQISPIKNNLDSENVFDSLIYNDELYVVVSQRDKNIKKENNISGLSCKHYFSRKILKTKINFSEMNFTEFYNEKICWDSRAKENGGRIAIYNDDEGPSIIMSVYDYIKNENNELALNDGATKYISINLKTNKKKDFAFGFRNPQGLLVLDNGIIISTEHGPRGGDEINKVEYSKNYGWPIASYGEKYGEGYENSDEYHYKKNHKKFNFKEPIYSFVPSIGISQIIEVNKKFMNKWENNILISSLRNRSLYRVIFNDKFERVITMERIHIGKRMRDIDYNSYNNSYLLALEEEPASIGIIKSKK